MFHTHNRNSLFKINNSVIIYSRFVLSSFFFFFAFCMFCLLTTNFLQNVRSHSLYSVSSHPVASHITSYSIASPDPYIVIITQHNIWPCHRLVLPVFLFSPVLPSIRWYWNIVPTKSVLVLLLSLPLYFPSQSLSPRFIPVSIPTSLFLPSCPPIKEGFLWFEI